MENSAPEMLLWDCDGTLVSTEKIFYEATARILAQHGYKITEQDYIDAEFLTAGNIFDSLKIKGKEREWIQAERAVEYRKTLAGNVTVIDGVREALEVLSTRYRNAVVTCSAPEDLRIIMKSTGLSKYFELLLPCSGTCRLKPYPDLYHLALKKLDIAPSSCVAIEDSVRGIRSAKAAQIRCIAYVPERKIQHSL